MKVSVFSSLVLVGLAAPLVARAATTTTLVQVGTTTISSVNYNVYDLKITTDTAWTNERLDLNLTKGSIYQDSVGSSSQPNPGFFAFVPTLQYDTYFTIPQSYPNISSQGTLPGFAADTETSSSLGVSWFAPTSEPANAPGTYVVAQLTLSSDATGTYSGLGFDTQSNGVGTPFSGTIGTAVPEPASLGLLACAGIALLARRKKA